MSVETTLPRGVLAWVCRPCGLPVWRAATEPERWRGLRWVYLEPFEWPALGGVTLNRAGRAVPNNGRFEGLYQTHHCPARVSRCKYCYEPVLVLHQPPGSVEMLAVLNAQPASSGTVALSERGHAIYDPARRMRGPRYHWHTRHQGGKR